MNYIAIPDPDYTNTNRTIIGIGSTPEEAEADAIANGFNVALYTMIASDDLVSAYEGPDGDLTSLCCVDGVMHPCVCVGNWDGPLEVAAQAMDDDLREELHGAYAGKVTPDEFVEMYAAAHKARFGETWVVA